MTDKIGTIIEELLKNSKAEKDIAVCASTTKDPLAIIKMLFPKNDGLCICEGFNGIRFSTQQELSLDDMMRLRVFNESGDLEVWKIDDGFGWRYIGETKDIEGGNKPIKLFDKGYFRREKNVRLWGIKTRDGLRYEPRMAAANLEYPISNKTDRVKLKLIEYSKDGVVQFVRYVCLTTEGE